MVWVHPGDLHFSQDDYDPLSRIPELFSGTNGRKSFHHHHRHHHHHNHHHHHHHHHYLVLGIANSDKVKTVEKDERNKLCQHLGGASGDAVMLHSSREGRSVLNPRVHYAHGEPALDHSLLHHQQPAPTPPESLQVSMTFRY